MSSPKRKRRSSPEPVFRKFRVQFEGEIEITISDALLKSCNTDEWRAQMYPFTRDEQFVEHIAYNMMNGTRLRNIDGYANQPEERVQMERFGAMSDWNIEAVELKPDAKARR